MIGSPDRFGFHFTDHPMCLTNVSPVVAGKCGGEGKMYSAQSNELVRTAGVTPRIFQGNAVENVA